MARLFVAALPDPATARALGALPRPHEPGVRWVPPENWHVTLRFLGDVEPAEVIHRLDGAPLPAATARLGPAVERLGRRQVVVPVAGVDRLAIAVRDALTSLGEEDRRPFRGHLTIARTRPDASPTVIGAPVGAQFAVTEIVLVESDRHPTGAVYTDVGRFPVGVTPT